jgi:hypothetical protein
MITIEDRMRRRRRRRRRIKSRKGGALKVKVSIPT